MNVDELREQLTKIVWFHQIDLGSGIITPGVDPSAGKLPRLKIPENLNGMSVLDIGAWNGFFSFEAERRGASRVLATDSFVWRSKEFRGKEGFELARKVLNSKVEDMEIDIMDISPDKIGNWDLVFCLGVLYHLRHPLLALERVSSVTGKQLILETVIEFFSENKPAMVFYPGSELANDPTNWWVPNQAAVIAMLKDVGFSKVEVANLIIDSTIPGIGRATFHAWK